MLIKNIQQYICNVWLSPILLKKMFLQNLYHFFGEMEGILIGGHGDNDQK
jgi:hypothetical protein